MPIIKKLMIFVWVLFFAINCLGNGGPFYFETILKHSQNNWRGYIVLYLEPVAGTLELEGETYRQWYELTYMLKDLTEERLRKIVLLPRGRDRLYGYSDVMFRKRYKADDEIWQKFIIFKDKHLNTGSLLVLIPKHKNVIPVENIVPIAVSPGSLPFVKQHPPGEIQISLNGGFDLSGDNLPDIVVFNASNGSYTRTYVLKRAGGDWHIIHIHYPL